MYNLIWFILLVFNFGLHHAQNSSEVVSDGLSVNEIADQLLNLIGNDDVVNKTNRVKLLRDKLQTIDSYVVDKETYNQLLLNETRHTNLNETNFYNALSGNDTMQLLYDGDVKSLYLKMKEKMNRDDVLAIMAARGPKKVMKSARRMMNSDFIASKKRDRQVDVAIDELIGEVPNDNHVFGEEERHSPLWDPQIELEERQNNLYNTRRIFRGERTTIRYYPFMVSVHLMGRFWCGGVIYYNDLVITSGSCLQLAHNNRFFRENPSMLSVRVGSNHSRLGGELIEAQEVYFHPGYNPRTLSCNIALIRLQRHLRFSYHRVPKRIDISHQDEGMPFTAEVLLLGWGVTKSSQKMAYEPIYLQRKFLPVYPNEFCREVYGDKFITKNMFCAGTFTTGEGACDHDAGGPAVLNGKLVGIISFGPTVCGYPNAPTVFTLVGAFADWIETVNESMPHYYRGSRRTTTTTPLPMLEFFQTHYASPKNVARTRSEVTEPTDAAPPPDVGNDDVNANTGGADVTDDDLGVGADIAADIPENHGAFTDRTLLKMRQTDNEDGLNFDF